MPVITSLTLQKKRKDRWNLEVDGEFLTGLYADEIGKFDLYKGKEISQKEVEEIVASSELGLLFDKVLRFLSFRPRSVQEIRTYLKRKDVHEDLQDLVIERLQEKKFLDDVSFAKWWIEQRSQFRPKGKRVLSAELRQKGVAIDAIEDAFLQAIQPSEEDLCFQVAEKKKKLLSSYPREVARKKLFSALLRTGFSFPVVKDVIDKAYGNE